MGIVVIRAPSNLGLRAAGVEKAPQYLSYYGLESRLKAQLGSIVQPPCHSLTPDPETGVLNAPAIAQYARQLADEVGAEIDRGSFPLVVGGDCSILLGPALALRRRGRYGLCFLDGHADFYSPESSPLGEVADMDLAIVTGRGPDILTNIENQRSYFRDEDVAVFGPRDLVEASKDGSPDIRATGITVYDNAFLERKTERGLEVLVRRMLHQWQESVEKIWLHFDVDVADTIFAVDYHQEGGMAPSRLVAIMQQLLQSTAVVGMDITIFNPRLDPFQSCARQLLAILERSFSVTALSN
ncbi:MAG: arginase family protein [Candidatus Andersenbacteria bacterium]